MVSAARQYGADLQRSFAAAYALLERPKIAQRAVVLLLAIHTGLLAYSAYVHSPTLNEPGHLVAGLSYWRFGRFDIYNVNPPLVKMVAALPVMAVGYEEDWSGYYTGLGARPEFGMGVDFVAANEERSFFLFTIARWACIPFSWLGGMVCFLWARDLYGLPAGVLACVIWCFEPNILAHASLITPDTHATSLGLAACYTFWRWLRTPTWSQAILTGVTLGLAELAKTTLILFYPLWPLMWMVDRWFIRNEMQVRDWLREAAMLAVRMSIGLFVVNLGYAFEGSFEPLRNYQFVSQLFAGNAAGIHDVQAGDMNYGSANSALLHNRFEESILGAICVPFPRNYLLGLDAQRRDFENYGRPSYLGGHWQSRGWWYYYEYAATIKIPLGDWGLLFVAIVSSFGTRSDHRELHWHRDQFILLAPPLVIFAFVSSQTGFSEHFRYILPGLPFVFIWVSQIARSIFDARILPAFRGVNRWVPAAVVSCAVWSVTSSLWIFPHSISYFNELTAGPRHGSKFLLSSNIDWGQDLRYLSWWWKHHRPVGPTGDPLFLAYFGYCNPSDLGLSDTKAWPIGQWEDLTTDEVLTAMKPGYYAISVNLLREFPWIARDGNEKSIRMSKPALKSLWKISPHCMIGYSIVVFRISE